MKKFVSMLLVAALAVSMIGCGNKKEEPAKDAVAVADAVEILTKTYECFDDDMKFPIGGGSYENMTADVPGAIDPADTESLAGLLQFPVDSADLIDDAASMLHMMNANTFTGAAFHLENSDDVDVFVESLKENIMGTQWMCGFPDTLNIFVVNGEYVVSAFGNADIMENFKTKLNEVFGDSAVIVVEESLI